MINSWTEKQDNMFDEMRPHRLEEKQEKRGMLEIKEEDISSGQEGQGCIGDNSIKPENRPVNLAKTSARSMVMNRESGDGKYRWLSGRV